MRLPQRKALPVGEHQANGMVENAIREIRRHTRVLRSALEEAIGKELENGDPVLAWLPRQAADLMSRYKRGPDGRTPEQRRSGKAWRKPAIAAAFGERLYFREVGEGVRVLKVGRYIGHHGRTGALLVMTEDGVKKGTGVRRLGEHDRWSPDGWERLKGLPWAHDAERPVRPGESLIEDGRLVVPPAETGPRAAPVVQRRIYIRREEVFKYGATAGCPACDCVLEEKRITVPHSEACRARITAAMSKDESGQARLDAYADKRRENLSVGKVSPHVVDVGEKDVTAKDAAGEPEVPPEKKVRIEEPRAEVPYVEDPEKRAAMKWEAAPEAAPKAKPKVAPAGPSKRPGELRIESKAKPKPTPATGAKRPAETPEELDPRAAGTQPERPGLQEACHKKCQRLHRLAMSHRSHLAS